MNALQVTGAVTSFVKTAVKSERRKPHLSVSDLITYTTDAALVFMGKCRQDWTETSTNVRNFLTPVLILSG